MNEQEKSKTDFRQIVRDLITQKHISIAKLSRLTDLNSGTLYKYLREESEITAANLAKVLDVLKTLPDRTVE